MPSVFSFSIAAGNYKLYVGEFSTIEGLSLFASDAPVQILEFQSGGPATEENDTENLVWLQQSIKNIQSAVTYFHDNPSIDLVDFAARIGEKVILSTHDDGECSFALDSIETAIDLMKRSPVLKDEPKLIQILLDNPSRYVSVGTNGKFVIFEDFDSYVGSLSK